GGWSPRVQTGLHVSRLTRGRMLALPVRGYHPLWPCFPDRFRLSRIRHWPGPRSLATTSGVSVDVLSSRYCDVSVPCVRLKPPTLFGDLIPSFDNGSPKPGMACAMRGLRASCPENLVQTDCASIVTWSRNSVIEGGFPHSEIHGSKLLRSSPWLIAA